MSHENQDSFDRPANAGREQRIDPSPPALKGPLAGLLLAGLAYLGLRASTLNPDAILFSLLVYGAEIAGFVGSVVFLLTASRRSSRGVPEALPGRTVDVFVVADEEPLSVVRRTLIAAVCMHYPHITHLVDQKNRLERRDLALELGVTYITHDRDWTGDSESSRGATRSRLPRTRAPALLRALQRTTGRTVAFLCADHTPSREFLSRTLGHFRNPRVGLVSTPLSAADPDLFDRAVAAGGADAWLSPGLRDHVIQPGRDARNAAMSSGSAILFSRQALRDIGGLPEVVRAEDIQTSLLLHLKGWHTVFHPEPLAFCGAQPSLVAFIHEHARAGRQAFAALRDHGSSLLGARLSYGQKLAYLGAILQPVERACLAVFYLTPLIALLLGQLPVDGLSPGLLAAFVVYRGLGLIAHSRGRDGCQSLLATARDGMARLTSTLHAFRSPARGRSMTGAEAGNSPALWSDGGRFLMAPQWLMLASSAIAVVLGVIRAWQAEEVVPYAGTVFMTIWALGNLLLAFSVILLAQRGLANRRRERRLAVSLPAMINHPGTRLCSGVIDAVSSTGFRYNGLLPKQMFPGDFITGLIMLPDGPQAFIAEVHTPSGRGHPRSRRTIGCSFQWPSRDSGDRLLDFLFTSNPEEHAGDPVAGLPTKPGARPAAGHAPRQRHRSPPGKRSRVPPDHPLSQEEARRTVMGETLARLLAGLSPARDDRPRRKRRKVYWLSIPAEVRPLGVPPDPRNPEKSAGKSARHQPGQDRVLTSVVGKAARSSSSLRDSSPDGLRR